MTNEDKDFLEANRGHYNTAVNAGYVQDLGQDIKMRMVEIIKTYFAPAYLANLWCGPCIMDMVKYLYVQYDAMPIIKHETFPKHDEPETFVETELKKSEQNFDNLSQKISDVIQSDSKGGNGLISQITTPKKKGRKPKGK